MDTVAGIQSQKKRDEATILKGLILTIDKFVEGLANRLENPNKAFGFLGSPAPPAEGDMKYNSCVKSFQSRIGNVLAYRSLYGTSPLQYEKLRKLLEKTFPSRSPKDKYDNPKIEFLYGFRNLFLDISQGGYEDCKPYQRIINLFVKSTKSEEYKFDYDALLLELSKIIKKVDSKIENAEAKEIIEMAMAMITLEAKQKLPLPPTESGPLPEEPPRAIPEASDVEIESAPATAPSVPPKTPLSSGDRAAIAGIVSQLVKNPRVIARKLTMDQIRQMAENIYRRRKGIGGRKTYRKKMSKRKSRKVRRV